MILSPFATMKTLDIWNIRGHDKVVLINDSKLHKDVPHYRIVFTKSKSRAGKQYYLSYKTIKAGKREWHMGKYGQKVLRYAVPVSRLEDFEFDNRPVEALW